MQYGPYGRLTTAVSGKMHETVELERRKAMRSKI